MIDTKMTNTNSPYCIMDKDNSMSSKVHMETVLQSQSQYTPRSPSILSSVSGAAVNWGVERMRVVQGDVLTRSGATTVRMATISAETHSPERDQIKASVKSSSEKSEQRFILKEITLLKKLAAHQNILQLLGCCVDTEPYLLIAEPVLQGSMQNYLRHVKNTGQNVTSTGAPNKDFATKLLQFMVHIAEGAVYLSSRNILHRDLSTRTVLLTSSLQCKLTHFGLAKNVTDERKYDHNSQLNEPVRWMAPESLAKLVFNTKSDVWSFGVLIWEMVTLGATPYQGKSADLVRRQVKKKTIMTKPAHCSEELYSVMTSTWAFNGSQRPSFQDLLKELNKYTSYHKDLILLDRYPENYYVMLDASVPGEIV